MMIKNEGIIAKRFYGLHMVEGVAEYREPGKEPSRLLILENAIKEMDSSFEGRPTYVNHVDVVDVVNLPETADGYVVKSFFNPVDGKHWVEFMITTQEGLNAINQKWKLSNAYTPTAKSIGGQWHGVDYHEEVTAGKYDHLAIVSNPRYAESIILTPEEFKSYCNNKELELKKLSNSKDKPEGSKMLKFFKRQKVENDLDVANTMVELPLSKKEMSLEKIVNEYDQVLNMHGYANGDHMVKVGEEEMSVNDLISKHMKMCDEIKQNAEKAAEKEAEGDIDEGKKGEVEVENKDDKEKPADEVKEEKKENSADDEEKADKKDNFVKLANAHLNPLDAKTEILDTSEDKVARGKTRYGSK